MSAALAWALLAFVVGLVVGATMMYSTFREEIESGHVSVNGKVFATNPLSPSHTEAGE